MIAVKNLTKRYGEVVAVDDISFQISKGEVVGFLGPNGAGKTTTMRMITGYLGADGGSVEIDGKPFHDDPAAAKSKIGYLPENNPLYDDMTVLEYLDFVAEMRGMKPAKRASAVQRNVKTYGLTEMAAKDIGELSKGYRQRVGLAQASLADPPIMILDEPTSGLDPNQIIEIRNLIREIGKTKTVILSTHNLGEVEATCSRVLIISGGKLIADDTPEALESRVTVALLYARLKGDGDLAAGLQALPGVAGVEERERDGDWRIFALKVDPRGEVAERVFDLCVANRWKLSELRKESTSLENVFTQMTRR
ncbi:MAG: ATP-binding cassette domain-containing protein [Myxococcales bacterium]|nr:ATP-binding cassette domain-containing protein [Myxococcales bacterium]